MDENTPASAAPAENVQPAASTETTQFAETSNSAIPATTEAPEGTAPAIENADSGQPQSDPQGQQRNKTSERIQQLVNRAKQAEAQAAQAQAALAALQGRTAAAGDPLNYANDHEYTQALVRQAVGEARAEFIQQQAVLAAQQREAAASEVWNARASEFRAQVPDFEQVAYSPNVQITPIMAEAIQTSDFGPQVAYFLGKNPAIASEIATLSPLNAAIRIGQLSERFGQPVARKTTAAPPPPSTLTGHGSGAASVDPAKMSMAEYEAWVKKGRP